MRTLLIGLAVVVGIWLVAIVVLVATGRRSSAREIAAFVPNLVFLFRGLLRDPEVPRSARIWIAVGLVWIASPIDLIPEFIPVAGPLDDAIVAALLLRAVARRAGGDAIRRHWRGSDDSLRLVLRLAGRSEAG